MLNITLAQLKNDIAAKMKGTSIREIGDFYATAGGAANRMLARIDPEETRRTTTMQTPFYDNIQDYVLATDYKRMIDIRPQANRFNMPGRSHFEQTPARQFNERLSANSFSIHWNNFSRSLRAQQLPRGNCIKMDSFDGATANGAWIGSADATGLYTEVLNFTEGNASLGFNLSGGAGSAVLTNLTSIITDLSAYNFEDASFLDWWIPMGTCGRMTSITMIRGSSSGNYISQTVTTKVDGTAFNDGWNKIAFNWYGATQTGTPDNTKNTYRKIVVTYTAGAAITGMLLDNWTDALGTLYEMEYYSEYLFTSSTGAWKAVPTLDTDIACVGPASYEILKTEMMIDVTKEIRTGAVQQTELADWRLMLNGTAASRYVKDPPYHGLFQDYMAKYPSSAIVTASRHYTFDV